MISQHIHAIERHVTENETITFHDLLHLIGKEANAVVMILLALFALVLSPLPANSLVFGVPLLFLSTMHLMNRDLEAVRLPLVERPMPSSYWRNGIGVARNYAQRLEALTRPRWPAVLALEGRVPTGLALVFLSFLVLLPIPFVNIPGLIGIIFICLGALQRDGLFVLGGYGLAAAHLAFVAFAKYWLFLS
jgi:hypothetical protein